MAAPKKSAQKKAVAKKAGQAKKASAGLKPAKKPARPSASDSIDEQLEKYRSMRDFKTTAEPSGGHGKAEPQPALPFVIQKHAATRLHYDFRLGWHGVLKSWAVAKGPSYVVADKRLAVQVEDHPMEYGGFEGTIPKGQYGGGTVMLWDEGTWEPVGDGEEGLRTGRLKFILHGKKLQGKWTLIRMGGKAAQESKPNWLLIKEHDEFEKSATSKPIIEEKPDSVITGRDLTQIAAAEDHVWDSRSGLAADERKAAKGKDEHGTAAPGVTGAGRFTPGRRPVKKKLERAAAHKPLADGLDLSQYPKTTTSDFVPPQLASSATTPPNGPGWVHELKLDGYRMQAHLQEGKVSIFSRNGLDWTARVKGVAAALSQLDIESGILDGEVVALDEQGLSSFAALQAAFDEAKPRDMTYYCFDLLELNGHNLRNAPLMERKNLLHAVIANSAISDDNIRYSEHLEVDGTQMFQEACALGAEGIISKQLGAVYISGRSSSWTKTKCIRQQELVIGGFTSPANKTASGIGALLLGYYHGDVLVYAGRTGTGFTQQTQQVLRKRLDTLRVGAAPFQRVPGLARKGAMWVQPEMVAEVRFSNWTADGMVRQASFKGLREDKPASEVKREKACAEDESPRQDLSVAEKRKPERPPVHSSPHLSIRLTHPDRVIDAESGLTKQTLAEYYDAIAERMLPHIADRPLSIVRCPDGSTGKCFFQKHVKIGLPKGVGSVNVPDKKTGEIEEYITFSSKAALVGMAQMNVLELHPWGSSNMQLEQPDRLVFDLDPDEALPWRVLAESAEEVRKRLAKLGLKSFLKGTGGKGLHIVVPIKPQQDHDWTVIKAFAHAFAQQMENANPKRYLTRMTKAARAGKIYLDYLRNERGATAVAPYSPRRRAGVPVSIPFAWSVLEQKAMPHYRVAEFQEWISELKSDPWKPFAMLHQVLTEQAIELVGGRL